MTPDQLLILLPAFFLLAALYTSVGHAGASGYLAAMALLAIAPETMRPTALALNILVATCTTWRFWKAGYVSWRALPLRPAYSPSRPRRPLHRRLQPPHSLCDCSDCYRLERRLPGGICTHWDAVPSHGAREIRAKPSSAP